uniref:AsIV-cont00034-ORF2 n=1 Tax=Apophua simplicipes ichnovirus TaxID=1329648 RepID=S5DYT4_9VIRU|nr:AsIV-cont00034-ORF2 [Apophua simplicipes ichnovirus]
MAKPDYPTANEWTLMFKLIVKIDWCNERLFGFKIRDTLCESKKAELVRLQRKKAMLIAELKTVVRHYADVSPIILQRIFPF